MQKRSRMTPLVSALETGIYYLRFALGVVAGLLILAVFFCVSANVFGRFVLNSSYDWAEAMSRFFFIWAVMIGAGVGCLRNENIAVSFVKDAVPRPVALVFEAVKIAVVYAVCVFILTGFRQVVSGYVSAMPLMGISMTYLYVAMLVFAVLLFVANTADLLRLIAGRAGSI